MNLVKKMWQKTDVHPFISYLSSFKRPEKVAWSRSILNTNLEVLALETKTITKIATEIYQGNYQSFLDLKIFVNYESIALYGMILSRIKDYDSFYKYLIPYLVVMENWAHVDLLKLPINGNEQAFITLSDALIYDQRPFVRRLSLWIMFHLIKDEQYLDITFSQIKKLKQEESYYVIMMAGWLLSEAIILYKDQTLNFIKNEDINKKIIHKAIQKCRESRRLSQIEKDALLMYKKK